MSVNYSLCFISTSKRLTLGCSAFKIIILMAILNSEDVCFFISRTISSSLFFLLPHMNMAWHNTPAIYFKPFFLLAMFPWFNNNLVIFFSYKNVYPIYCGKGNKVQFIIVMKFIFPDHRLKYKSLLTWHKHSQLT